MDEELRYHIEQQTEQEPPTAPPTKDKTGPPNHAGAMTDLSRELRADMTSHFTLTTPALVHREQSVDGTEKFLLRLEDGRRTLANGPTAPAALERVLEREGVGLRGRVTPGAGEAPNQFAWGGG